MMGSMRVIAIFRHRMLTSATHLTSIISREAGPVSIVLPLRRTHLA